LSTPEFAVILPAAGQSVRYGAGRGKLLESLAKKPVLRHSIAAFARRRDVRLIVIATPVGHPIRSNISGSSSVMICDGGNCRAESVRNALQQVPPEIEWVAVHDAARPLVSQGLIDRVLAAAIKYGAAAPALAVAATIKRAGGPLPAKVEATVPRQNLWAMQTPQIMRRGDLMEAFERCPMPLEKVTDDAQLLELMGREVWLAEGEEANLKITTPNDLLVAEMMWRKGK
jgi:2-C-methyl-D-erythritol 4-phosphate cytidylyltransferase